MTTFPINFCFQNLLVNTVQRRGTATLVEEKAVPKVVGWWMAGIAGMCFGAVAIGGLTRLTESGLSMVIKFQSRFDGEKKLD